MTLLVAPPARGAPYLNDVPVSTTWVGACNCPYGGCPDHGVSTDTTLTATLESVAYDNGSTQGDMFALAWKDQPSGNLQLKAYDTRRGMLSGSGAMFVNWNMNRAGHTTACTDTHGTTWSQGCGWITADSGSSPPWVYFVQVQNRGSGNWGTGVWYLDQGRFASGDSGRWCTSYVCTPFCHCAAREERLLLVYTTPDGTQVKGATLNTAGSVINTFTIYSGANYAARTQVAWITTDWAKGNGQWLVTFDDAVLVNGGWVGYVYPVVVHWDDGKACTQNGDCLGGSCVGGFCAPAPVSQPVWCGGNGINAPVGVGLAADVAEAAVPPDAPLGPGGPYLTQCYANQLAPSGNIAVAQALQHTYQVGDPYGNPFGYDNKESLFSSNGALLDPSSSVGVECVHAYTVPITYSSFSGYDFQAITGNGYNQTHQVLLPTVTGSPYDFCSGRLDVGQISTGGAVAAQAASKYAASLNETSDIGTYVCHSGLNAQLTLSIMTNQ